MRWLRQWGPAVAWAGLIWLLSSESFSGASTSRIILPLLRWLFPHAELRTLELWHFLIRKTAHFVEYFIFSLLLLRGIRGEVKGWRAGWALAAVAIAAGYAALDELHQSIVPLRGPSAFDSLLDTAGAATAQLLTWLRARWRTRPA